MNDGPDPARSERQRDRGRPVETLASQALTRLASIRAGTRGALSSELAQRLRAAVLSPDPADRDAVLTEMRDRDIPDNDIVDVYVPHVARLLGDDWCSDTIGFAETSIGSSRLQSLLRDLTPGHPSEVGGYGDIGVAVVVASDDDHTLGAMVLTHQLRRLGVSVRVMIGAPDDEVLDAVAGDRYDAVMLSSSRSGDLGNLRKFVENIKRQTKQSIPVVIGGRAVDYIKDVSAETGADFATSDPQEALRLCGLTEAARLMRQGGL